MTMKRGPHDTTYYYSTQVAAASKPATGGYELQLAYVRASSSIVAS